MTSAASHPPAGPAGQLARGGGRAADDRRDLVERKVEHVVQDEGQTLGRRQGVEHDQQRQPDRVGEQRLVRRIDRIGARHDRIGHVQPSGSSRRDLRVRRVLSETRAMTVVSQAPRFSTSVVSERLSRSQVS